MKLIVLYLIKTHQIYLFLLLIISIERSIDMKEISTRFKHFGFILLILVLSLVWEGNLKAECKYTFCSCCEESVAYTIYYVNGDSVAGNIITSQHGCTTSAVFNAISGVSYYVLNDNGCPFPVFFTGCFCDTGTQKIKLPCCSDEDRRNMNDNIIPKEFKLFQNFPNPFNPTTKIQYTIPYESHVKLIIYDVNGKKIQTIVDKTIDAGNHEIFWDAKNVSSGVYFYKIEAGTFTDEKKMVVVK